jgi:hypothetical protein
MNLTKDIYEYILNFVDDIDAINMLSVNKKFSQEIYIKKFMVKRYPGLHKFKEEKETYRRFFIKMNKHIYEMKKHNIPYFEGLNPREIFMYGHELWRGIIHTLVKAIEIGNLEIVKFFDKNHKNSSSSVSYLFISKIAASSGQLHILRWALKYCNKEDYYQILITAINFNQPSAVNYLLRQDRKNIRKNIKKSIHYANHHNKSMVEYLSNILKTKTLPAIENVLFYQFEKTNTIR